MNAKKYTDLAVFTRLLRQARPYWLHLFGILLLELLSSVLALLYPLPLKLVVDSAIGSHPLPSILQSFSPQWLVNSPSAVLALAVGLSLAVALSGRLLDLGRSLLGTYTGEKLVIDFQTMLFHHAQALSLAYHDSKGSTDSTYRIRYDAPAIRWILIETVVPFGARCLRLAVLVYATMLINSELALVALAVAPFLFLLPRIAGSSLRGRWLEVYNLQSSAMSVVQEVLGALRVVKAFGQEEREQDRFRRRSREGLQAYIGAAVAQGGYGLLISVATAVGTAAVLFFGAQKVLSGTLTLGELLMAITYVAELFGPLEGLGWMGVGLPASMASGERALSLLDLPPTPAERKNARRIARTSGRVVFRNVSFGYGEERQVLHDISFEVAPGALVGISGTTGAGKSTLVSLLIRLYDPTDGQILLDDVDLRDYRLADLRSQFAIVLQEPVLFSTSIAENIAYARHGCRMDEIVAAAKAANAHQFITRLPDGYETDVGERGISLSGGERQRISLARAFLKDAPLLILDEPTSSVDIHTEAVIMDSMTRLTQGRTTFVIAHRLSTLEKCTARLTIEDGRLYVGASSISTKREVVDPATVFRR